MKLRAQCLVSLAAWLLVPAITWATDVVKQPEAEKPADCQLILEGKHIEKLVLSDKQGKVVNLVRPDARVLLPAGDYQIEEIEVPGGYITRWFVKPPSPWPPPRDRLLTLSPDKPCRPNIGGPLKATIDIKAKRVGRLVKVSYSLWLRGSEQWPYFLRERAPVSEQAPLPQFAIYQGDRDITAMGAGSLEYG